MRNLKKMQTRNDGTRTLFESIMAPEVIAALREWRSNANPAGVLIGGLALSYYVKPRYTEDVDVLYLSETDIPEEVLGFRKSRLHAFEHHKTGVEIEVITPQHVKLPVEIAGKIIATAVEEDGFKIASPSGLVVAKLFRYNAQDRADIINLLKSEKVDIAGFSLPQQEIARYIASVSEAEHDPE